MINILLADLFIYRSHWGSLAHLQLHTTRLTPPDLVGRSLHPYWLPPEANLEGVTIPLTLLTFPRRYTTQQNSLNRRAWLPRYLAQWPYFVRYFFSSSFNRWRKKIISEQQVCFLLLLFFLSFSFLSISGERR